jgi:hypothetical protein
VTLSANQGWRFIRFGLLVTGKGEAQFLPKAFRSFTRGGHCVFEVIRRVEQLRPRSSTKVAVRMTGTRAAIPSRDEETALAARRYLELGDARRVLLIDDLEHASAGEVWQVFERYRGAFDALLSPRGLEKRAAIHLLVNMLEAYYFGDVGTINSVLGTELEDFVGDVEAIRHPKGDLKRIAPVSFDEVEHGELFLERLDMARVLSNPNTCASLRSLFAWCRAVLEEPFDQEFRLDSGVYSRVTGRQIADVLT